MRRSVLVFAFGLLISTTAIAGDPKAMATEKAPAPANSSASSRVVSASPSTPALSAIALKITGVKGLKFAPAYTGGPTEFALDVENVSASPVEGVVVKVVASGLTSEQKVSIPAKTTVPVRITDTAGLSNVCAPRDYEISLIGSGAPSGTRKVTITPTCTFTSNLVDEWNLATPDHVEAEQKGNVYLTNIAIVTAPTCTAGVKVKAQVANQSKLTSPSLLVQVHNGSTVKAQTAAAFPLGLGEHKEVLATPVGNPGEMFDRLEVTLVDWSKGLGSKLVNHSAQVQTKKSCVLAYALAP